MKRQRERAEVERRRALTKRDRTPSFPRLTQEELLEEARQTEEINLKSLGMSDLIYQLQLLLLLSILYCNRGIDQIR